MNLNDDNLDPLDDLLTKHLSRQLDPQLGKAAARFAAHAMREAQIQRATPHARAPRSWWLAASSTGAVAAAILIAFGIITYRMNSHTGPTSGSHVSTQPTSPVAVTDDTPMERTLFWRTLDEGTVFLDDDTPARQLRRQQVEEVAWTDRASGERRTSYSIPQEELMLVAYDKY